MHQYAIDMAERRLAKPRHCLNLPEFSEEWFIACDEEFVRAMREAYPEREVLINR